MAWSIQYRDNNISSSWKVLSSAYEIMASWEVNRAGSLTLSWDIYADGAMPSSMLGSVIRFTHDTAGRWDGIVTQTTAEFPKASLMAQSYEIVGKKRLAAIPTVKKTAPGIVLKAALDSLATVPGLPVTLKYDKNAKKGDPGYIDTVSRQISIGGTPAIDFYDELIPQLTTDIGMEWRVDGDRKVTYQPFIGDDKSGSVYLNFYDNWGTDSTKASLVSMRVVYDLFSIVNYIDGFGMQQTTTTKSSTAAQTKSTAAGRKVKVPKKKPGPPVTNTGTTMNPTSAYTPIESKIYSKDSTDHWGSVMVRRDYPRIDTTDELNARIGEELSREKLLKGVYTLEVTDVDGIWSKFREGDLVFVGVTNDAAKVRVMARSLDVERGVMTLACEQYKDAAYTY